MTFAMFKAFKSLRNCFDFFKITIMRSYRAAYPKTLVKG